MLDRTTCPNYPNWSAQRFASPYFFLFLPFLLHRAVFVILNHEIRAQSEASLHRKKLAIKKKILSCTMLHRSIVTHAQARRIASAWWGRYFAPRTARQERRGVPERNTAIRQITGRDHIRRPKTDYSAEFARLPESRPSKTRIFQ